MVAEREGLEDQGAGTRPDLRVIQGAMAGDGLSGVEQPRYGIVDSGTLPWLGDGQTAELPITRVGGSRDLMSAIDTNPEFSRVHESLSEEDRGMVQVIFERATGDGYRPPSIRVDKMRGANNTLRVLPTPMGRATWTSPATGREVTAVFIERGPYKGGKDILVAGYTKETAADVLAELLKYNYSVGLEIAEIQPEISERVNTVPSSLDLTQVESRTEVLRLMDEGANLVPKSTDSNSGEIFSSTGKLGREKRPFNRLYENRVGYSTDALSLLADFREMTQRIELDGEITRAVMRGLVTEEVFREVMMSDQRENIEVALNVSDFTGDDSWFVYLAKNSSERTQIVSTPEMIEVTEKDKTVPTESPGKRIQRVLDQGYRFVDSFAQDQVDQVLSLWQETFGWSREQVESLRKRLLDGDEGLWFSAVVDLDNSIVTAVTAEKLDIPSRDGELSLVESTEWITRQEHRGKGLMTATLDMLNAQILADLRPIGDERLPLIYAECNFQSRSDRAGHGAGFEIPQRSFNGQIIPQLIIQNVNIGDGADVPTDKLRDFTFMYLSAGVINTNYSPEQVQAMLANIT